MKIAIITSNLCGVVTGNKIPKQNLEIDYFYYNDFNLPVPLSNLNNRLKGKYLKMQTHRYLPDYDLFVWVDGNVRVNSINFVEFLLLNLEQHDICLYKHFTRKNVYEELFYLTDKINNEDEFLLSFDNNKSILKEGLLYKENLMPEDYPLYNTSVFIRRNNVKVNNCFDDWWKSYIEYCNIDQAMFSFVSWENNLNIKSLEFEEVRTDKLFKKDLNVSYKMNDLITKESFFDIVKSKLSSGQPFSFARYSDGEIMLLNRREYNREYINIIKKLWGYEPTPVELEELGTYLSETLKNVDVIGFPTPRHLSRKDYFSKAIEVFENYVDKDLLYNSVLASVDVCYELLYYDRFSELLQDLDTLNYVSCRNLDNEFKARYNIKNINSFIIAPEAKFTSGYVGDKHYPTQFNQIKEWIKTLDCKGQLCLVGGGVISKMYNVWFKEQGGISLDIGAVFDLWSGKKTRGLGRGLDVECNDYKL